MNPDHSSSSAQFAYPRCGYRDPAYCGGAWVFTRYDEVAAVLRDPNCSAARAGAWVNVVGPDARREFRALKGVLARTMVFADGRRHRRLRQAVAHGFRRAALEAMLPSIGAAVDDGITALLAAEARDGEADFMAQFARPLPVRVIAGMLGVPFEDALGLVASSDAIARFIGEPAPSAPAARAAEDGAQELIGYFERMLQPAGRDGTQPDRAGGGLLATLVDAHAAGRLSTRELIVQGAMLLFAGHETTRNLLGNGIQALLRHPDEWRRLAESPARARAAVFEVLRYDSPVQYTGRRVIRDCTVAGRRLRRGDLVIAHLAAANRDPEIFPDPDVFRVDRHGEATPLSFGWGPHVCIGAELSVLEAWTAFARLRQRLPGLARIEEAPTRIDNAVYRGLARLRVRCGAPADGTAVIPGHACPV